MHAGLYTLRIVAGAAAITVPLSFWMISFSMFIFLLLAFIKGSIGVEYWCQALHLSSIGVRPCICQYVKCKA